MPNALPLILAAGAALLILGKGKSGKRTSSTPKLYYVQTETQFRAAMRTQKSASPPILIVFFPPGEDGMAVAQSFKPMVAKGWTVMIIGAAEASQWMQKPVQPSFTIFSKNKKVIRFGWNDLAAMAKELQKEGATDTSGAYTYRGWDVETFREPDPINPSIPWSYSARKSGAVQYGFGFSSRAKADNGARSWIDKQE